jgi:phytoene synthase
MPSPSQHEGHPPDSDSCESLVRAADYDRYLSALFAPADVRPHLLALYAFNYEVARTAESVSQPLVGQIRLQWWRDAVAGLYAGTALKHPVVSALGEAITAHALPRPLIDALIDAREADLEPQPFADMAALETYADATSGHVMRLAARVLGAGDRLDALASEAGIAYALAGQLRALPYHAARGRTVVPKATLSAAGSSAEDVLTGRTTPALRTAVAALTRAAEAHLASARRTVGRAHLPAILPAALVPLTLRRVTRPGFDPLRMSAETPGFRRQLALLAAVARRRI